VSRPDLPRLLTIAGSDSSGGAGIQADLKTFAALGGYGASVLTAITAQNTQGVQAVHPLPQEIIARQCESVFSDLAIDAVKIGMLGEAPIIETVAAQLRRVQPPWVVLDPVMFAKGGQRLLADAAVQALREQLLPLADLITPNLSEAAALLGCEKAESEAEMVRQGRALVAAGCRAVLLKGGGLTGGSSPDHLFTARSEQAFPARRVPTKHTHGTGCTLSSAIAACYARSTTSDPELRLKEAVGAAKGWLTGALAQADRLDIGHGIGPVHHSYLQWPLIDGASRPVGGKR